ncbi:coenzyme PQQ precursor peptide PqqA [Streptomyces aurantiacus]|nr:coenzyme PQQ precursor peptide PqqA [Streptomyces aurantiacus]
MTCGGRRPGSSHRAARGPKPAARSSPTMKGKVVMNNEPQTQHQDQPPAQTGGGWQTPDFTVVDTALEVTAYSLRKN